MENIRKIRLFFEKHKNDQKINLLWYLAGLATIPAVTGIAGLLLTFEKKGSPIKRPLVKE